LDKPAALRSSLVGSPGGGPVYYEAERGAGRRPLRDYEHRPRCSSRGTMMGTARSGPTRAAQRGGGFVIDLTFGGHFPPIVTGNLRIL
jgi:hypothetical protein